MMPLVGDRQICPGHELLARRQQERAHVALVPQIMVSKELLEAVEVLTEKGRVLATILHHPIDEARARVHRRHRVPVIGRRNVSAGKSGGEGRPEGSRGAD